MFLWTSDGEKTTLQAKVGEVSVGGKMIVGKNWAWIGHHTISFHSVVVVVLSNEVERLQFRVELELCRRVSVVLGRVVVSCANKWI